MYLGYQSAMLTMSQPLTQEFSHDILVQPIHSLEPSREEVAMSQPLTQEFFHDISAQPIHPLGSPCEEETTSGIFDHCTFWADPNSVGIDLPFNLGDNYLSTGAPDEDIAVAATPTERQADAALDLCGQGMAAVAEIPSSAISEGFHSFTIPLPLDIGDFFNFNGQPESGVINTPALTPFDEDADLSDVLGSFHAPAFAQIASGHTPNNAGTGSAVNPHSAMPVRQEDAVVTVSDDYGNDSAVFSKEIADPKLKQRDVSDEVTFSHLEIPSASGDLVSPSHEIKHPPAGRLESRCTTSLPEDIATNHPPPDLTAQKSGSDICPQLTELALAVGPAANEISPPSKPPIQAENRDPISSDEKSARPSWSPRLLSIVIPVRSCQALSPRFRDELVYHSPVDGTDDSSTYVASDDGYGDEWPEETDDEWLEEVDDEWPEEADNPLDLDYIDSSDDPSTTCTAQSKSATNQNRNEEIIDLTGDDVPGENVPGDDVPGDNVPGDNVPGDDVPGDDVPDHTVIDLTSDDVPGDDVPDHTSTDTTSGNNPRNFLDDDDVFTSPSEKIVAIDLSGPENEAVAALQIKRKAINTDAGRTMPQWATSKRRRVQE